MPGVLCCGDNLEVLRDHVSNGVVDLIYLDPPFNSRRTHNVVHGSTSQDEAFKDYWLWEEAAGAYARLVESAEVPKGVRGLLRSLHDAMVETNSDLLAYLTMMTTRLLELHRVLKPHGSMYLHCDPTASHYLKVNRPAFPGDSKP